MASVHEMIYMKMTNGEYIYGTNLDIGKYSVKHNCECEHEFDHVLLGYYDKPPFINAIEVSEWKWMSLEKIILELNKKFPENTKSYHLYC